MDRDTIDNFDTIDMGLESQRRADTEIDTMPLAALDAEDDLEPTIQTSAVRPMQWRDIRMSDPVIAPPRRSRK